MNWRDKAKLIKRGFLILRERDLNSVGGKRTDYPYSIAYCSSDSTWSTYYNHRYETKAARRRAMEELLKDNHIIED